MQEVYLKFPAYSSFFVFILLVFASLVANAQAVNNNYKLGPGDNLSISVFQEEDLSIEARINTKGSIDFPLIGELKLVGLTRDQAEALLDKKLRGDYLVDPQITISIANYRKFFISGEVRKPGSYEYHPDMTVRQAVALAGDFTDRASRKNIFIIKEGDKKFSSTKIGLDGRISPGDTIMVKESFF